VLHRALIERKEEEDIHLYSGFSFEVRLFEATGFAVIKGEHDTEIIPLDEIKRIKVYEQGVLTS
jgi:hypothetical protein